MAGTVKPVADTTGARVTLRRTSDGSNAGNVQVDDTGSFRFSELQREEYVLSVFHEEYEPFRETLFLEDSLLDIEAMLNPLGSLVLAGVVKPIGKSEGARIVLQRVSDGAIIRSRNANDQGGFSLEGLQPDEYLIHVYHGDFEVTQHRLSLYESILSHEIALAARSPQ